MFSPTYIFAHQLVSHSQVSQPTFFLRQLIGLTYYPKRHDGCSPNNTRYRVLMPMHHDIKRFKKKEKRFASERDEVTESWRELHSGGFESQSE